VALDLLSPALSARLGYGKLALLTRFQSIAPGVEEQVGALAKMVGKELSLTVLEGAEDEQIWATVRDTLFPQTTEPQPPESQATVAKVGCLQPRS
jgi:hypothetical protein